MVTKWDISSLFSSWFVIIIIWGCVVARLLKEESVKEM